MSNPEISCQWYHAFQDMHVYKLRHVRLASVVLNSRGWLPIYPGGGDHYPTIEEAKKSVEDYFKGADE